MENLGSSRDSKKRQRDQTRLSNDDNGDRPSRDDDDSEEKEWLTAGAPDSSADNGAIGSSRSRGIAGGGGPNNSYMRKAIGAVAAATTSKPKAKQSRQSTSSSSSSGSRLTAVSNSASSSAASDDNSTTVGGASSGVLAVTGMVTAKISSTSVSFQLTVFDGLLTRTKQFQTTKKMSAIPEFVCLEPTTSKLAYTFRPPAADKHAVDVWSLPTNALLFTLKDKVINPRTELRFNVAGNRLLAFSTWCTEAVVWNLDTGSRQLVITLASCRPPSFSFDDSQIVCAKFNGGTTWSAHVRDAITGEEVSSTPTALPHAKSFIISPWEPVCAGSDYTTLLLVMDYRAGSTIFERRSENSSAGSFVDLCFGANGSNVLIVLRSLELCAYDYRAGSQIFSGLLTWPEGNMPRFVRFNHVDNTIIVKNGSRAASVFEGLTGKIVDETQMPAGTALMQICCPQQMIILL
jgi:hypothetical protein